MLIYVQWRIDDLISNGCKKKSVCFSDYFIALF